MGEDGVGLAEGGLESQSESVERGLGELREGYRK